MPEFEDVGKSDHELVEALSTDATVISTLNLPNLRILLRVVGQKISPRDTPRKNVGSKIFTNSFVAGICSGVRQLCVLEADHCPKNALVKLEEVEVLVHSSCLPSSIRAYLVRADVACLQKLRPEFPTHMPLGTQQSDWSRHLRQHTIRVADCRTKRSTLCL